MAEFSKIIKVYEEQHAISGSISSATAVSKPIRIDDMQKMISKCKVVDRKRSSTDDEISALKPKLDDVLYSRGKEPSVGSIPCATLILSGKVCILAGIDEFRSEVGPWGVLGLGCLYHPSSSSGLGAMTVIGGGSHSTPYTPDFTAYIASDSIRYVRITVDNIMSMFSVQSLVGRKVGLCNNCRVVLYLMILVPGCTFMYNSSGTVSYRK